MRYVARHTSDSTVTPLTAKTLTQAKRQATLYYKDYYRGVITIEERYDFSPPTEVAAKYPGCKWMNF